MTDLQQAVTAFLAADVTAWDGLPAGVRLGDLEPLLAFDRDDVRRGDAGDPVRTRLWLPAETTTYFGGLRLWLDDDEETVVLLEGLNPLGPDRQPLRPPALGEPDATYDAVLGPFHVRDGEQVYAERGIALQVYPDTGALVGVIGFTPTAAENYRRRLQPHHEPTRPLPRPHSPAVAR